MFDDLIASAYEFLAIGRVDQATESLNWARERAFGPEEREACHTLGNDIQKEIFNQYMNQAI